MLVSLQLRPSERQLRQFGWIAAAAFPVLSFLLGRGRLPLFTLGALSLLFSLIWPRGNRPLFVAMSLVSYPIGFVVSHFALAVLFFGVLTPVGLLFRLLGRDPLARRFEREKPSYWVDLPKIASKKEYFRQF
jgi:Saxitoxin biosynthesis operon protein SxtJ